MRQSFLNLIVMNGSSVWSRECRTAKRIGRVGEPCLRREGNKDVTIPLAEMLKFYEEQHQNPANRVVHHVAHTMAILGALFIFVNLKLGLVMIACALPLSWLGHLMFERNVPAFFDTTDRGGMKGGIGKKIVIALGGVVWSAACAGRVLGFGSMAK